MVEGNESMMKKKIPIIVLLVFLDQLLKIVIYNTIAQTGNSIEILNILKITYVENTGAAFGLFSGNILLIGIDIVIIYTIVKLIISKKYKTTDLHRLGYSLILAGGIGNLIDRLFRGYVIDYIDISRIFNYPVFNLADVCIVVGVIIIMAIIIINTVKSQENAGERV